MSYLINSIVISESAILYNSINRSLFSSSCSDNLSLTRFTLSSREIGTLVSNLLKEFIDDIDNLQLTQSSPISITKNMIDKKFKQILSRNNDIKKIRIHDLRHSHASLLINQGEDYLVVKERLGHASITTTIVTYSHLYPSKQKSLANKLDEIF